VSCRATKQESQVRQKQKQAVEELLTESAIAAPILSGGGGGIFFWWEIGETVNSASKA